MLPHNKLNANPKNVEEFLLPSDRPTAYQSKNYKFDKIRVAKSRYQPILSKEDVEEHGLDKALARINMKILDYYHLDDFEIEYFEGSNSYFNNKETYALNLEVTPDNILILHKDLEFLINLIIENKPSVEKPEILFKKKGVSHKKILAKEIAKHVAEEQWLQETENKIKVGEMCDIVWSKIIDSGLGEELPDQRENIKPWIKEVTPAYASEAGRPPL